MVEKDLQTVWDEYCVLNKMFFDDPNIKEQAMSNSLLYANNPQFVGFLDASMGVRRNTIVKRISSLARNNFGGLCHYLQGLFQSYKSPEKVNRLLTESGIGVGLDDRIADFMRKRYQVGKAA